ncbi:DinB family protein [Viridibacillus sp. NPDC093762]|uniref:DinB family protein n=1 Tax=Viridibacillus sp. NPDC093762 TaxID=3390720 RepID=UPI003D022285
MYELFQYNWEIREEWFQWCETIPNEELVKKRTGGMGSILKNLFHVIDCEQLWINQMQGTPIIEKSINEITNLNAIKEFSSHTKPITEHFIKLYINEAQEKILVYPMGNGNKMNFTYNKILHHIITHEIHHIGQLSVWAREIGKKPVSSDLIMQDIF